MSITSLSHTARVEAVKAACLRFDETRNQQVEKLKEEIGRVTGVAEDGKRATRAAAEAWRAKLDAAFIADCRKIIFPIVQGFANEPRQTTELLIVAWQTLHTRSMWELPAPINRAVLVAAFLTAMNTRRLENDPDFASCAAGSFPASYASTASAAMLENKSAALCQRLLADLEIAVAEMVRTKNRAAAAHAADIEAPKRPHVAVDEVPGIDTPLPRGVSYFVPDHDADEHCDLP